MHREKEKLIAMLLCILLLSNVGLSIVLAADTLTLGGLQVNPTGYNMEVSTKAKKATLTVQPDMGLVPETITFTPRETGAYKLTLNGTKSGEEAESQISYSITTGGRNVRLAARYTNGNYYIMTGDTSDESTTIDVILQAGVEYTLAMNDSLAGNTSYSFTVEESGIAQEALAMTNIPAYKISDKSVDAQERVDANLEPLTTDFKFVEFSEEEIKDYLANGVENQDKIEPGGFLEGLIVDLIIGFGTVFIDIVTGLVGANVKLTIDNIIFNRYDKVVIDLTPLGGIPIQDKGEGIFYNAKVGEAITVLYNGLKQLAFVVYVLMLLYIGVKILFEIGGRSQKKYFKYLEYWVSGLVIFLILPYCLPVIPATNNALIEALASEAEVLNGDYSVDEVLERLGGDKSLLGEDAEVVELRGLIDERIDELNAKIFGEPTNRKEAQAGIENKVSESVSRFEQINVTNQGILQQKVNDVISMINAHYLNWTDEIQQKYEQEIGEVRNYIFENSTATSNITTNVMNQLPSIVKNVPAVQQQIQAIMNYMKNNATALGNGTGNATYNTLMSSLKTKMQNYGLSQYYAECQAKIDTARRAYVSYANYPEFKSFENVFTTYKDAMIYEEIEDLKELKKTITNDVMTMLKEKAQAENRLVYAIAWVILLFQMFAVLFMYYRRAITIVILIIIFPLIMAFYVIDKAGDGKSQSLDSWIREFTANILVQLLHAVIYIVLVNAGIEVCNADPENNWFFLILAVCFLFPGERILRSLLGLNASSLGGLKNNIGTAIIGATTLGSVAINNGRKLFNEAKDIKKNGGIGNTAKKRYEEAIAKEEKAEAARNEKIKERKKKAIKVREQRNARIQRRMDLGLATPSEQLKLEKNQKVIDKWKEKEEKKKEITGMKIVQQNAKTAYRTGKMTMKKAFRGARKAVGMTMGAVEGMENFGEAGATSAFATATKVTRDIGGFKPQPKTSSKVDESKSPSSQFTSQYNGTQKVAGNSRITTGNTSSVPNGSTSNQRNHVSGNAISNGGQANSSVENTKLEVKTRIQNIENNKTNP